MKKELFNYKKSITTMLIKFIDQLVFFNDEEKSIFLQIALKNKDKLHELYKVYDYINTKEEKFNNGELDIRKGINKYYIGFNNTLIEIEENDIKKVIAGIIDILEEVLPIGTVVLLKHEFIKKMCKDNEVKEVPRFIINKRFLSKEGSSTYFNYSVVPYPTGEIAENNNLYVTTNAIDKVIYRGYSDVSDEAYIYIMKNEMILNKKMHSISFASEEERELYSHK